MAAVVFAVVAMTNHGLGQGFAPVPTTVQLPTFRQFRVDTSVMVPVGGSATLGSVRRSQTGVTERGVPILGRVPGIGRAFNNRGIGLADGTSQARVHATLIDLEAMDRAIRGTPEAQRVRERMGMAGVGAIGSDVTVSGGRADYRHLFATETEQKAAYLSQNMGGGGKPKTVTKVKSRSGKTRVVGKSKEPPLILKGSTGEK